MKRRLFSIMSGLACLSLLLAPETSAAPQALVPAPDGERFLFIVDISENMEKLKAENEATLYDLLLSGLYGQMQTGDSYGLWTFHKDTHAGRFPLQVWDMRRVNQLATIAAAFLSNQNYEESADMKPMTDLLATVIGAVSNLTVFIISDGNTAIRGTAFDKAINAEYKKKRRERSAAKRPFVTTLSARNGLITTYSVNVAGTPIKLPERPPPAIAKKITPPPPGRPLGVVLSNTPAPPAIAATTPTAETNPPPPPAVALPARSESKPPPVMRIVTKSNTAPAAIKIDVAEAERAGIAPASGADQTNSAPVELSTQPPPLSAPAVVAASVQASAAETSAPHSALAAIMPAPMTVAARELQPEPEPPRPDPSVAVQAAALPTSRDPGSGLFLAFGGLLMAAALFLLVVVIRLVRPAPGCSLITQSMERR